MPPPVVTGAKKIFVDDEDGQGLLAVVGHALSRFDAGGPGYCLMRNHYPFVLHTRQSSLSLLMHHINGVYTRNHIHRHHQVFTCSSGASGRSWWTEMPACWKCAATSISTQCAPSRYPRLKPGPDHVAGRAWDQRGCL
jgi:hypothetical protein